MAASVVVFTGAATDSDIAASIKAYIQSPNASLCVQILDLNRGLTGSVYAIYRDHKSSAEPIQTGNDGEGSHRTNSLNIEQ